MSMSDHEERLRIMALALRRGIDIRGPEAVSILEEAAEFIEFMYDEVYGGEDTELGIVGTSDESGGTSAFGSTSSGSNQQNARGQLRLGNNVPEEED